MKVAIVGNSHLAALKLAVQRNGFSHERIDIDFWGLPGPDFDSITCSAGLLQTPRKSFVLHISDGLYESLRCVISCDRPARSGAERERLFAVTPQGE